MNNARAGSVSILLALVMTSACHRTTSTTSTTSSGQQPAAVPADAMPPPPPNPLPRVTGCVPDDDGVVAWRDDGRAFAVAGGHDAGAGPNAQLISGVDHVDGIVSDGTRHCARTTAGGVFCWGNYLGSLAGGGVDDSTPHLAPMAIPGIDDATQVALGSSRACVIRADHTVWCWGDLGPLGVPGTARPQAIAGFENAVQLALVDGTVCVRTSAGTIRCAGSPAYGLAGVAPSSGEPGASPNVAHPADVAGLTAVAEIAMSRLQACARLGDGTVKCWGAGFGATPVAVHGVSGAIALALGDSLNQVDGGTEGSPSIYQAHAIGCAWSVDGHASCWRADADHLREGALEASMHAGDAQRTPDLDGAMHSGFGQETVRPRACGAASNAPLREFVFDADHVTSRALPLPI